MTRYNLAVSGKYIKPHMVKAFRPEGAIYPRLEIEGKLTILAAQIKRVFPLSMPEDYLSLQDSAGKEMAILRNTEQLEPQTKKIFEQELDRRYFTPKINAIHNLKQEAGMWHFVVDTQRGPTEFYVRNWRDNAHEISPGRWQIFSVDGGRFDIPNLDDLDPQSRRLISSLL